MCHTLITALGILHFVLRFMRVSSHRMKRIRLCVRVRWIRCRSARLRQVHQFSKRTCWFCLRFLASFFCFLRRRNRCKNCMHIPNNFRSLSKACAGEGSRVCVMVCSVTTTYTIVLTNTACQTKTDRRVLLKRCSVWKTGLFENLVCSKDWFVWKLVCLKTCVVTLYQVGAYHN